MKSILISKPPKQVANILNGKQTIIISKNAPKDWKDYLSGKTKKKPEQRTAYIYCTKTIKPISDYDWGEFTFDDLPKLGKVVAKFVLREVEELYLEPYIYDSRSVRYKSGVYKGEWKDIMERYSCINEDEMDEYLGNGSRFYAWHISDMQIFDEPKKLSEFKEDFQSWVYNRKPRPPFSWCYVEVKE